MTETRNRLTIDLNLRATLRVCREAEQTPQSRYRIGSPCRLVRLLDLTIHLVIPEALERLLPNIARHLRKTSPRWGRSWAAE